MSDNDDPESTENLKPWSDRWKNRRIGFHLKTVNPILLAHGSKLLGTAVSSGDGGGDGTCSSSSNNNNDVDATELHRRTRIFVPLCGKAIDMAHLASLSENVRVVGLDGIRVALEEFANEHPELGIKVEPSDSSAASASAWERFEGEGEGETISLWKGDYFALDSGSAKEKESASGAPPPPFDAGTFDAIYDRASIVAIHPSLREAYVRILDRLLAPGGGILMVALERKTDVEEARNRGPPFSIPEATIRELFASDSDSGSLEPEPEHKFEHEYTVTILDQTDQLVTNPQDRERYPDLDQLLETVFWIQKGGGAGPGAGKAGTNSSAA